MTLFATRITLSVVLPALLLISLHSCMTFRESPRKIKEFFSEHQVKGAIRHFKAGNIMMEYAEAGDSTKPLILFVHGSPGSLSAFLWYLVDNTLLEHGHLITMDRP